MRYADPLAQAEIDRLRAQIDRLDALASVWVHHGEGHLRSSASGQLKACGTILKGIIRSNGQPQP